MQVENFIDSCVVSKAFCFFPTSKSTSAVLPTSGERSDSNFFLFTGMTLTMGSQPYSLRVLCRRPSGFSPT